MGVSITRAKVFGSGDGLLPLSVFLYLFCFFGRWDFGVNQLLTIKHRFAGDDLVFFAVRPHEAFGQSCQSCPRTKHARADRSEHAFGSSKLFWLLLAKLSEFSALIWVKAFDDVSVIELHAAGESDHLKIVPLGPNIKRMVVALGTLKTSAKKNPNCVRHVIFGHVDVAQVISNRSGIFFEHGSFGG